MPALTDRIAALSPAARRALVGAAVGGGLGLLRRRRRKSDILRDLLLGAGVGGGVAYAAPALLFAAPAAGETTTPPAPPVPAAPPAPPASPAPASPAAAGFRRPPLPGSGRTATVTASALVAGSSAAAYSHVRSRSRPPLPTSPPRGQAPPASAVPPPPTPVIPPVPEPPRGMNARPEIAAQQAAQYRAALAERDRLAAEARLGLPDPSKPPASPVPRGKAWGQTLRRGGIGGLAGGTVALAATLALDGAWRSPPPPGLTRTVLPR